MQACTATCRASRSCLTRKIRRSCNSPTPAKHRLVSVISLTRSYLGDATRRPDRLSLSLSVFLCVDRIGNKNSSRDEIANVNFFTTISHTYFKTPKREPISFNKLDDS